MQIRLVAAGVAAISIGWWALAGSAQAQGHHSSGIVDLVRDVIQQFADVRAATTAGYALFSAA